MIRIADEEAHHQQPDRVRHPIIRKAPIAEYTYCIVLAVYPHYKCGQYCILMLGGGPDQG